MHRTLLRLPRFLRAGLLALLVLGLAVKPVLTTISSAHAVEHALAAQADAMDHALDHDHVPSAGEHHDNQPEHGHASGVHGLMHLSACADTPANAFAVLELPAAFYPRVEIPLPATVAMSAAVLGSPFRPPIA